MKYNKFQKLLAKIGILGTEKENKYYSETDMKLKEIDREEVIYMARGEGSCGGKRKYNGQGKGVGKR